MKINNLQWLTIDTDFIESLRQHDHQVNGIIYTVENLEEMMRKQQGSV